MRVVAGPFRSAPFPPPSANYAGGPMAYWPPVGATGAIDLSHADAPGSHGLFTVPDSFASADHLLLGRTATDAVSAAKRQSLAAMLKLASVPTADRVLPLIEQVLTEHAEPDAIDSGRSPLEPLPNGELEVRLGPMHFSRRFKSTDAGWGRLKTRLRHDYRRIKDHDADAASRWAGCMQRKLDGVEFHDIADAGDRELPPKTVITDNFNRINNPLVLGASLELWVWNDQNGTFNLTSNQARTTTLNAACRTQAAINLSSSDHYAQALIGASEETQPANVYCMVRNASAGTNYTGGALFALDFAAILKYVASVLTVLDLPAYTFTAGTGYTIRMSSIGSSHSLIVNGATVCAATDTAITGNLRVGLNGEKNSSGYVSWDDFIAADQVAPSGDLLLRMHNEGLYVGAAA